MSKQNILIISNKYNQIKSLQFLSGNVLSNHIEYLITYPCLRKFIMIPFNQTQRYNKGLENWFRTNKEKRILAGDIPKLCYQCNKIIVFNNNSVKCYNCREYLCKDCEISTNKINVKLCKKCVYQKSNLEQCGLEKNIYM